MTPRAFLRRFCRRLRHETGAVTVEFMILFPVFTILLVSGVEMGMLSLRQVMLERGIDITVRSLRIGAMEDPTHATVRAEICRHAMIVPDCNKVMHLELTAIAKDSWTVPELQPECVDRTEKVDPKLNFTPGQRNEYMLMRACVVFDPMFPNYGLAPKLKLDDSGGYRLIASTAFVNEP